MVKYQYFSHQVFHIAENYLEAAERCLEGRSEEGSDAFNALLWPSEHCAIIACELFLKSLIAQTEKPEAGVIYTPTYKTKIPQKVKNKTKLFSPHICEQLIDYVKSTETGLRVWSSLDKHDQDFLINNTHRFAGTRYPFERDDITPDQTHLKIAQKLFSAISEVIMPDENGSISLELNIIDNNEKQLPANTLSVRSFE